MKGFRADDIQIRDATRRRSHGTSKRAVILAAASVGQRPIDNQSVTLAQ